MLNEEATICSHISLEVVVTWRKKLRLDEAEGIIVVWRVFGKECDET